jgi:hypothetical protein
MATDELCGEHSLKLILRCNANQSLHSGSKRVVTLFFVGNWSQGIDDVVCDDEIPGIRFGAADSLVLAGQCSGVLHLNGLWVAQFLFSL